MPRQVDQEQRERDIVDAAVVTLASGGFSALTLNAIAKRMGGSITLITHYFKNRDELIRAIVDRSLAETNELAEELIRIEDRRERLKAVLVWFLPLSSEDAAVEGCRIALAAHQGNEPAIRDFFERVEPAMRRVLRVAIADFVPPDDVEPLVDLLRVWTSGVALATAEHPEIWTAERQLATLELYLSVLPLPALTDLP